MIARLVRFYGGDPWRWLADLPLGIVRGCIRLIPQLQAEEAFAGAERVGIGTGSFKESDQKAVMRRWRDALPTTGRRASRATPRTLAALGIGFRRVPVKHGR